MVRILVVLLLLFPITLQADDWSMGGQTPGRNPVSLEKSPLTDWHIGDDTRPAKNIRWTANVGSRAIGGPVVANGLVWVGTNNESLLDPKITDDRGVY
ncbi:MAG: PQQ-binding-like beta-propeller repeat protein, partial [Fimbriiglobus sp.]